MSPLKTESTAGNRYADLQNTLGQLSDTLAEWAEALALPAHYDVAGWQRVVNKKLLPRLRPDFPLMVAVCGGGSAGKSTLFNALAGAPVSVTGGKAGLNQRSLIAMAPRWADDDQFWATFFDVFGYRPQPLKDPLELTEPGDARYVTSDQVPPGLLLLDTPDFDTGAARQFTNRQQAERALELADLLIYIFTNANYNNRDSTDFMARILTDIGLRKAMLVYRVYPDFTEREVADHAGQVAAHLYGDAAESAVLGVYRVDESNAVAEGRKVLTPRAVGNATTSLVADLGALDRNALRMELHSALLEGVLRRARRLSNASQGACRHLALYGDAVQSVQSQSVRAAAQHLPMDLLIEQFVRIWLRSDPAHIKMMRRTGKVLDLPLKGVLKVVRWFRTDTAGRRPKADADTVAERLETDMLAAGANLYRKFLDPRIALLLPAAEPVAQRMQSNIDTLANIVPTAAGPLPASVAAAQRAGHLRFDVAAHPALRLQREALRERTWQRVSEALLGQKEILTSLSGRVEQELTELAVRQRRRMDIWDRTRETFSALLNILPATAAATYVLTTGDPVGAVGIKVKLAGLFGLHDLYALVALPATSGLKNIDQKQLADLLAPAAQAWLNAKLDAIDTLFGTEISAPVVDRTQQLFSECQPNATRIEELIDKCHQLVTPI
jgi:hypothetical protein